MKKLILFLVLIFVTGCSQISQVKINNIIFNVEVADNSIERMQGLMFRDFLDEDSGMLFIFQDEGKHSFWMKNTLIPLDIIWINKDLEVVYISKNTQPCQDICNSIIPDKDSLYVLEINANLTEKYNIKIGDKIKIS